MSTATIEVPPEEVTVTEEQTDLFDLVHAWCNRCHPTESFDDGDTLTALCGEQFIYRGNYPMEANGWPLNPCTKCAAAFYSEPCINGHAVGPH